MLDMAAVNHLDPQRYDGISLALRILVQGLCYRVNPFKLQDFHAQSHTIPDSLNHIIVDLRRSGESQNIAVVQAEQWANEPAEAESGGRPSMYYSHLYLFGKGFCCDIAISTIALNSWNRFEDNLVEQSWLERQIHIYHFNKNQTKRKEKQ